MCLNSYAKIIQVETSNLGNICKISNNVRQLIDIDFREHQTLGDQTKQKLIIFTIH